MGFPIFYATVSRRRGPGAHGAVAHQPPESLGQSVAGDCADAGGARGGLPCDLGRSRGGSGALGAVREASGAGARGAKGRGAGLGRQRAGASPTARPPRTSRSPPRGLPVAQTSRPGRGPRYLRIVEGHGGPSQ